MNPELNHCGCEIDENCTTVSVCAVQDMIDDAVAELETRLEAVKSERDFWQKAVYEARDEMTHEQVSMAFTLIKYKEGLAILNKATGRE